MTLTDFSKLDAVDVQEAEVMSEEKLDSGDLKKRERKARNEKMRELIIETAQSDPNFLNKLKTLSDSVTVVNVFGFGSSGNLVVDKEAEPIIREIEKVDPETGQVKIVKEEKQPLKEASDTVGYRVQNIGKEPIEYITEEFAPNEEGVWVGTVVKKMLMPNETVDLTRKYMTAFCSIPEISFTLANGILHGSSRNVKPNDFDALMESYIFKFTDSDLRVHSDEVRINVGKEVTVKGSDTKKWKVKPEFEKVFGYLNNEVSKSTGGRKRKAKSRFTNQDVNANFIYKLRQERGLI